MGYFLEVYLCYPRTLHDLHNDYPLASETRIITEDLLSPFNKQLLEDYQGTQTQENEKRARRPFVSARKLKASVENKEKYILYYRTLQLYLQLGLEKTKVHRVVEFHQTDFLKKYIDLNTQKRREATSNFLKSFFKLMNNAVLGKTMENVRQRISFKIAHT